MISLHESIRLSASNLVAQLSAKRGGLPMWKLEIDPSGTGVCVFSWPTHNLGRITDALFRVEVATGAVVPPAVETALRAGLRRAIDNPLGVASMIYGVPWERETNRAGMFDGHSQREVLLGLTMLVRHRADQWARMSGERMIDSLDSLIKPDFSWDYRRFAGQLEESAEKLKLERLASTDPIDLTYTHGRLIEALVEFHETTGYERAIDLAARLVSFHMSSRRPAERVREGEWLHHHSLFGTYRGIFRFGELTGNDAACVHVARMLSEETMPRFTESGYIPETAGLWDAPETTSPGDAAQLALWVARWTSRSAVALGTAKDGRAELNRTGRLLDDVERLVRARLLPSQILVDPGFRATLDDTNDPYNERDTGPASLLRAYAIGAYGGVHQHPYGHKRPTTDVTAATLHSMCDVLSNALTVEDDVATVDLHFDRTADDLIVSVSESDGSGGGDAERALTIAMHQPRELAVRIPGWVARESLRLWVGGQERDAAVKQGYVVVSKCELTESALLVDAAKRRYVTTVRFALPARQTVEKAGGEEFRLHWLGNQVVAIAPNAPFLPFYPSLE